MTALARQPAQDAPQSTAGLLISLSHMLPRGHTLARRARQLAHRLNQHNRPPRALALAGAECLAQLLEETAEEGRRRTRKSCPDAPPPHTCLAGLPQIDRALGMTT